MWADLVAWFQSPGGARVLQTAIIPALAILVAGLLSAAIARAGVRATLRRADRAEATAAVAALVAAARATADARGDHVAVRRAARLRAEADVRTRILAMPGADLAADWAGSRLEVIAQQEGPTDAALREMRDALVGWVRKPGQARRLFAAPAPVAPAPVVAAARPEEPAPAPEQPAPERAATEKSVAAEPPAAERPEQPAADRDRFGRPAAGPRRAPAEPVAESAPEPEPELVGAAAVPPSAAAAAPVSSPAASSAAGALPAWQRTRAGERLQQERSRGRGVETPTSDVQDVPLGTAPVLVQRTHRAEQATDAEQEDPVRLESHQQARHARPNEQGQTGPATASTPAPAWLDTYDDEAQVTQNLDLKTPPPVSATSVRDRGTGEDLVPRS